MIHMKRLHWYTWILLGMALWAVGFKVELCSRKMNRLCERGTPFTSPKLIRLNARLVGYRKAFRELECTYLRLRLEALRALEEPV